MGLKLEKIAIIKNKFIYLETIVHILYSLEYSWAGIQYISGTKDLWYPVHAQTPYIEIIVDYISKRFIYKEIEINLSSITTYNVLLKLL